MEKKLSYLKLLLDKLGEPTTIDTFDDRHRVQKVICIARAAGLRLGYTFGWYIRGPYSRDLAKDYYSLQTALESGERGLDDFPLNETIQERLTKTKSVLNPPEGVPLGRVKWLELVASICYLNDSLHWSEERARETLRKYKGDLEPFTTRAISELRKVGLYREQTQ